MFISWLHFFFLFTLTMIAARTVTLLAVQKYPDSPSATALAYIFG